MRNLFFLSFSVSLLFMGCTDYVPPRVLKPYDPIKAGATIVESFDITGQVRISGRPTDITADLNYGRSNPDTPWQIVEDYEWVGYKISDFKKEYSPVYFLYD